jgi:hypothetical protein
MTISGLPIVADAALSSAIPAAVRSGSAADKKAFKTALGFEQMLVDQVVKSMAGESGPLAEGPYAETMQSSLSSALVGNGGLGLARQFYKEINA